MAAKALTFSTYRDDGSALAGGYLRSGLLPALDSTQGGQWRVIVDGDTLLNIPSFRTLRIGLHDDTDGLMIVEISEDGSGTNFGFAPKRPDLVGGYGGTSNVAQSSFVSGTKYSIIGGCTASLWWMRVFEMGNTTAILDVSGAPWTTVPTRANNFFTTNERLNGNTNVRACGPFDIVEIWDQTHALTTTEASSFVNDVTSDANVLYAWDMEVSGSDPGTISPHKGSVDMTVFETVTTDWTNPDGTYEYAGAAPPAPSGGWAKRRRFAQRNRWRR